VRRFICRNLCQGILLVPRGRDPGGFIKWHDER
jgi:hypothetical protein